MLKIRSRTGSWIVRLWLLLFAAAAVGGPTEPPSHIFGSYTQEVRNLCELENKPDGSMNWINCYNATDRIVVKQTPKHLEVTAKLNFSNGHACSFRGEGYWNFRTNDRLHAISTEEPGCGLTLFFFDKSVHTVAADRCSVLCGSRGSLQEVVLPKETRRKATSDSTNTRSNRGTSN